MASIKELKETIAGLLAAKEIDKEAVLVELADTQARLKECLAANRELAEELARKNLVMQQAYKVHQKMKAELDDLRRPRIIIP